MYSKTEEMHIFVKPNLEADNKDDEFKFMLTNKEHKYNFYSDEIDLCTIEVQYNVPVELDRDFLIRQAVQTLKDKIVEERAQSEKRVQRLSEKVDALLMLPHLREEDF